MEAEGLQIGEAFIIGGKRANTEAYGNDIAAFVRGFSDDDDLNALMVQRYGLPEGTNFADQLRSGRVSPDGKTVTGMLDAGQQGMRFFQFNVPTHKGQLLPDHSDKVAESAADLLRLGRDAAIEAARTVNGGDTEEVRTPIADSMSAVQSFATIAATGRDVNNSSPSDLAANAAYQEQAT